MAAKSNLVNMALCLTLVCLFCAAILGGVYAVTLEPIKAAAEKTTNEAISQVLPAGGTLSEIKTAEFDGVYYEYYESSDTSGVVAYAVKTSSIGFGGPLQLMVGVLADGTVWATSVLSHSETPGLGAKCTSDLRFIEQWKGFKGNFAVKKDGGDVDAITASTITSRAYAKAVGNAVALAKSLQAVPEVEEEVEAECQETVEEQ